ncbi:hypothetical protein KA005_51655, partial [bacterium]|nr:hypothetical protein [bacterium]
MKIKTEFRVFVLSTMLSFFVLGEQLLQADSGVKIWEEPLTIPTYRIGDPELNPMFYHGRAYQGARGAIYPYPFMDRLTDIREDRT